MDAAKAESVVNLLRGNRRGVLAAANACLLCGAALLARAISAAVRTPLSVSGWHLSAAPYMQAWSTVRTACPKVLAPIT